MIAKMPKVKVTTDKKKWPRMMLSVTYGCVLLAVVLVAAQFWLYSLRYQRIFAPNSWSAITLTNGQTYFGKLEQYGPHTLVLFNVYYLQATQTTVDSSVQAPVDEAVVSEGAVAPDTADDAGLRLYKLADDFHRPNDYLIINKNEVLHWQHLSTDSPIVKTIQENS